MKKIIFIALILLLAGFFIFDGKEEEVLHNPSDDLVVEEEQDSLTLDFISIQDRAEYVDVINQGSAPSITGDEEVDAYIRAKAEARGYRLRPYAVESRLVSYQGQRLQSEAKSALEMMQSTAKEEGMTLTFASGYRSVARQRDIFVGKLGTYNRTDLLTGKNDEQIDGILKVSSVPGYSKHHTGYAVDLGCGTYELTNAFMDTSCYAWLAEDDFANVRQFGFVPSYPVDGGVQGPDPESWEFIWIPDLSTYTY